MPIRKVDLTDLHSVSAVCLDAFMQSVAPTLQAEGIKTFQSIASVDALESRMDADNVMSMTVTLLGLLSLKKVATLPCFLSLLAAKKEA